MSTQKILTINPELFKFNGSKKSLKKKERKIKPLDTKINSLKSNKLKKELLKRVKDYQKKQELETHKGEHNEELASGNNLFDKSEFENSDFEREFNKSLTFLHDLSKKKKEKRNKTLKASTIDVNIEIPKDSIMYNNAKQPSYSCLKNGSKPTLKELNKTQKNNNQSSGKRLIIDLNNNKYYECKTATIDTHSDVDTIPITSIETETQELQIKPQSQELQIQTQELQIKPKEIQIKPKELQSQELQAKPIVYSYSNDPSNLSETSTPDPEILTSSEDDCISLHIPKINRTTRTYKYTLGKKNGARHIGLLIKNRETQKRIKQEVSQLKQQPIQEVKNYLRTKNLIKLGSQAPNDVLRKLYEDSILAGEITNNNANNLVYNFIN
jgi:hypothetical protein